MIALKPKARHAPSMAQSTPNSIWFQAFILFFGIALARFLIMLPLGLVEDEAYYWVWAQEPSAGYFDHTAGVGLAGWIWQQIFGLNFLGFRVLNGLLSLVTGFASLAACLTLLPKGYEQIDRFGTWLLLLVLGFTSVQLGHVAWVPDALYLPLLSLAVWQICRLLGPFGDKNYSGPKSAWAWAGLFFGLSILAKELVVLYAVLFCLFVLFHPRLQTDLRTSIWPWFGLSLIIVGGIPTLVWNANNDWILLLYQSNHAFVDRSANLEWQDFGNLVLAYVLILGPAFALAFTQLQNTWRGHWPLWALFALPSVGFFFIALTKGLQTQWALPSLHLGMLLLLPLAIQNGGWGRRLALLIPVFSLTTALVVVLMVPSVGLRAHNVKPVLVWESVYENMKAYQSETEQTYGEPVLLLANRYQEASLLNYSRAQDADFVVISNGPPQIRTLLPSLNIENRSNHYDYLWPELELGGHLALVVIRERNHLPNTIFADIIEAGRWEPEAGIFYDYKFGTLTPAPRPQLIGK